MSFVTPPTHAVGDVLGSADWNIVAGDLNAIWGGSWTPYTPTWAAAGTAPALGNGTLYGYYKLIGKLCTIHVALVFGSTTTGGAGAWTFTLPVSPAVNVEQTLQCRAYCSAATTVGTYQGAVVIGAGNTVCSPYLPVSASNCVTFPVQNANTSNTAGTGVPASATFPFAYGSPVSSNLIVTGSYETV